MTALYLLDDATARAFAPFALTRPVSELRAGAMLVRERWERALGMRAAGMIVPSHLREFEETGAPPAATGRLPAGAVVANARCLPSLSGVPHDAEVWYCGDAVAAVRLAREVDADALETGGLGDFQGATARAVRIDGRWLAAVWDLITTLGEQLRDDIAVLGAAVDRADVPGLSVLGTHDVCIEQGATIEPFVVCDASAGPVLVRSGAAIRAFTRLVGPCVIDGGSTILGDRVSGCSIGAGCMVRGEISESILIGNANKAHEGFVGHSVLGRWVNLGAGTTTSNLKNTYGSVALATPGGMRDTGQLKLGAFLGDHVKTGIGLCLTTGTVIGAGANVYGAAMPAKDTPAFSWGEGTSLRTYALEKFLQTAERAMQRRGVTLTDRARRQLSAAHRLTHGEG